ncbi:MAG: 2OG-Fe(II) oxygenase [Sulfobacillus sp.]
MAIKIDKDRLAEFERRIDLRIFGDWTDRLDSLNCEFIHADPFPHVVIDDFLAPSLAELLSGSFPARDERWHEYLNPIEIKYANDSLDDMPVQFTDLFYTFCTETVTQMFRRVTGIPDLEHDPYLHGAGLHFHPRGGKLDMHVDYGIHPYSGKERRLNLIIYLNRDWQPEWNGSLELWRAGMSALGRRIEPLFNRAVLFRTSDESWHGLPDPLKCPPDQGRKSFAVYWVSEPRSGIAHRYKAQYVARPGDPPDPRLDALRMIRVSRRITKRDLEEIYPEWSPN